jgi:hypothetical protein
MAVVTGTIKGINILREPFGGASGRGVAEVFVTYGAYTASADTTSVAGVGAAIAAVKRDGKTVTLKDVTEGQAGMHGTTEFFNDTLAVSTDAITGELSNASGTEIDAASGVTDRPCSFIVSYLVA